MTRILTWFRGLFDTRRRALREANKAARGRGFRQDYY